MNASNYIKFVENFGWMMYSDRNNLENVQHFGNRGDLFYSNILNGIEQCKIFEVDDDVKKLLALTDPPNINDEVKIPFPFVFVDVFFSKEELKNLGVDIKAESIYGILFTEGKLVFKKEGEEEKVQVIENVPDIKVSGLEAGTSLRLTMMSKQENGEAWFDTFNKNINLHEEFKNSNVSVKQNTFTDHKMRDFIHKFVINFLNFLNNPEVSYIEHVRSEKNRERRRDAGKVDIRSTMEIKLTGELKRYIDEIRTKNHLTDFYSHRFWVRGHWRVYSNERYRNLRGKKQWILPFIKGAGILVEKQYVLESEKNEVR